jgi:dTDP-4-amino-4,6-dideoxygalactose transaminase
MIPFAPPRIDQLIIDEVVDTLKSGWITTGPKTKKFEKELEAYCGCKSVLCLNSATSGLEIMLRWFGVGEGDEVILPAYTYAATANVVAHCGAKPVLVDVSDDFNIDPESIHSVITSRTKVIMPVDFGGWPCDYSRINQLVKDESVRKLFQANGKNQEMLGRILVLSDAAHSIGATVSGNKTGSLTDVSVFSFHAVKNLTTAEGGAIALNLPAPFDNEEIYKFLCVYTLHGQNKDALAKMQKGNWKYDIIEAGYKCNMTDLSAAIGLVELKRYDSDMLVKRKHICDSYQKFFNSKSWAQLPMLESESKKSSFHLYPLRIKNIKEEQRDLIIKKIFDKDVSVNVHFIPLPMLSFYTKAGFEINKYPATYDNYSREISLPVFYDLSDDQIKTVCDAVSSSVEDVLKPVAAS